MRYNDISYLACADLYQYARREALYTQRLEALAKKQEELLLEFERAKSAQTQQIKMYEDALEALRQEVASLENEGRELKAKLLTAGAYPALVCRFFF